jgi:CheY-like chemotaxis protein
MAANALIIDDNKDYVDMLLQHLEPSGLSFDHRWNAEQGFNTFEEVGPGYYKLIVTDITMEGQMAGMKLIRRMRGYGFQGVIIVASTGFNNKFFLKLSRWFMRLWGVDILVPKQPLKEGEFKPVAVTHEGMNFLVRLG